MQIGIWRIHIVIMNLLEWHSSLDQNLNVTKHFLPFDNANCQNTYQKNLSSCLIFLQIRDKLKAMSIEKEMGAHTIRIKCSIVQFLFFMAPSLYCRVLGILSLSFCIVQWGASFLPWDMESIKNFYANWSLNNTVMGFFMTCMLMGLFSFVKK